MTIGAWTYLDNATFPGGQAYCIIARDDSGGTRNYSFDFRNKGSGVVIELASTATPSNYYEAFSNVLTGMVQSWHHVGVSIDFTTSPYTTALYVDGVVQTLNVAGPTSGVPINGPLSRIGINGPGSAERFSGALAELFVLGSILPPRGFAALAAGARTYSVIAGRAIDIYAPMTVPGNGGAGLNEVDLSGNAHSLSTSGASTTFNQPPIAMFTPLVRSPPEFTAPAPPPPDAALHSIPFFASVGPMMGR